MAPSKDYPIDWRPTLIVPDRMRVDIPVDRPIRFRRAFQIDTAPVAADLWITACGVFESELNGRIVGDHVLDPGWTSYSHRHRLIYHDVTRLVAVGSNVIGVTVAEGWYRGRLGFGGGIREIYGSEIGPIALLVVTYADGTETRVETDLEWVAHPGRILGSGLYDGETWDLTQTEDSWTLPEFVPEGWSHVEAVPFDPGPLFVSRGPRVRRIEEVAPVAIEHPEPGRALADFGQNLAGRLRVKTPAAPGRVVTIRHAEVLEHGQPAFRPLRGAAATDGFVCGPESFTWEPKFTIHGFRYVQIDGWPGELSPNDLRAVVCHTDFPALGSFECSEQRLNQLHENVRWSARSNFVDIPTDCPQRDERLGWTGDIQVFADTAFFLFDCSPMIESWLEDLAAEQMELGTVPVYVPWIQLMIPPTPMAAWGDAAVLVPWALYRHFGDIEVLRRQYDSMCAWVDEVTELSGPELLWRPALQFGDWLDPIAPPERPASGRTSIELVATAYHAYSAGLLAEVAAVLGEKTAADRYARLAEGVRTAFGGEFVTRNGLLASDSQTAYAVALQFDLLATPELRRRAAERLHELVVREGFHIGTGFVGTPLICDALADAGYVDDAYHLLLQTEPPSWLYPVTMGATTVWERWDSMLPDGSVNPGEMTSFNHYALGAVASFLHRRVAGLAPGAPGYERLEIRPLPGGGLTSAAARRMLRNGLAVVSWERTDDEFHLHLEVPVGVVAEVQLPDGSGVREIGSGIHDLVCAHRPAGDDPPRPRPVFPS